LRQTLVYGRKFPRGQDVRDQRQYAPNYRKPPIHTRFKKGQSGNPRGRSAKNIAALLAAALNEKVTVTENGKRRQFTKREAVIAQLVNKSASAELRATKMLIDMREAERRAEPGAAGKKSVQPDRQRGGPTADRAAAPRHVQWLSRALQQGVP
jgi:hypothetical protein